VPVVFLIAFPEIKQQIILKEEDRFGMSPMGLNRELSKPWQSCSISLFALIKKL